MPRRRKRTSVCAGRGRLSVDRGEAVVHALGGDQDALLRDAEQRAELVARVPRGHDHARRSLDGRAHAGVEHRAVAQCEPLRMPQKRDVVDGDHRRRAGRERRRVGGVDDVRAVLAGRGDEPDREAGDVGAARQHHGLVRADVDAGAGHGDELPPAQLLKAPEKAAHVRLVAGLAGAEHVPVDQDAAGHEPGWSLARLAPVARERFGLGDAAARRYRVEEGGGPLHHGFRRVVGGHPVPRGEAQVQAELRVVAQHGDAVGHAERVERIDDEGTAVQLGKARERLRRADHRQPPGHRLERLVLGAPAVGERCEHDVRAAVQRIEVRRVRDDGDAGAAGLLEPRRGLQAGDDQGERHALGAQLGREPLDQPFGRVAVGRVDERADEEQAHGDVVPQARAALVDLLLRREVDRQGDGVRLDAERGEALPVAVVDGYGDRAVQEAALVAAAGRGLQVGGRVADRPGRGRRLAEAAGHVGHVDDERDVRRAVVRRVERLDDHGVGLPGGDHLVHQLGDGARAPEADERDRRDEPPAGGQGAPPRRSGFARRRHPHLVAELPQQAQIGPVGSRADHRDLVPQRGGAHERQGTGVRAGERRSGQLGEDEEDAHAGHFAWRARAP